MQDVGLSLGAQLGALERQQAPAVSVLFSSPSQLLYIFFPLLVLFVCFHAISSHSRTSPGLSISASIRAFRLHLATLQHFFPQSLSAALFHPPFYCLITPFVSLFFFRLLPPLLGETPVSASGVVVTYKDIFLSPAFFLTHEKTSGPSSSFLSIIYPADGSYSPLMRFLLHPFFLSPSSLVFWLTAGPFLLYSCSSYIYLHFQEGRGFSVAAPQTPAPRHPGLRTLTAVFICLYMPAVFMTWLVAQISPTAAAASFRYIGIEGAIYALSLLVFLYDPVVHSSMFGDPSIQFPAPVHIRSVTSVLAFFLFLFSPPPNDLLLLVSAGLSAALAALASSVSPLQGLSGSAGAASIAMAWLALGSKLSVSAPSTDPEMTGGFFFVPYSPPSGATTDAVTWTIGGFSIAVVGGMAIAGILWNYARAAETVVDALRTPLRFRVLLTGAVAMLAFAYLPFSFVSMPPIRALLSDPRQIMMQLGGPTLYAVTCTERTVLLGSIGAKTAAFWTPIFSLGNRSHKLKYFIGPLLCFLLFVGMASEHWHRVGPGFIGTVVALYMLYSLGSRYMDRAF
ncbi:transmembrane protein [Cystoisospora suis]|uniref:Transmembrane protein n=1 Tax=Cystoisospora suis TaxID=483139 RepID=A0A2C6L9P1_9APIC|nr:transmembrane protein [Cystoisospora suis]